MAILRTTVDLIVDDNITQTQAEEIKQGLADYNGAVLGLKVLKKVTTETKPEAWYHIHNGDSCRYCRRLADDGRA